MRNRHAGSPSGSGDDGYLGATGIHCGADDVDKLLRCQREELAKGTGGKQCPGAIGR